jgi:SAM-dependent methyltransferase
MKEHSIYEFPDVFRAVHMEDPGDIAEEVDFLRRVWARHLKRPVRRVLDVACGNSPHGQLLAREEITVIGIDRSPSMIAAGRTEAGGLQHLTFYKRKIERFSLPARGLDAAFFMSETFPVMVENADLLDHLRSVAKVVRKGGLYCIDIDRHDTVEAHGKRKLWRQRKVRRGPVPVDVREFLRPISWQAGAWIYELECRIHFAERTVITRDLVPVRYTLPKLLDLAARAAGGFKLIAAYADLSFDTPMDRCERRWLGVLRRL